MGRDVACRPWAAAVQSTERSKGWLAGAPRRNEERELTTAPIDLDEKRRKDQQAALERIRKGLATKVRILVAPDACPVCRAAEGAYPLDDVPEVPLEGCSSPDICNATYAPVLDLYGP
jgi:hypothetical protein